MILQTNRLTLREVSMTDIQDVHDLHSLPETDEFNTSGIPDSMEETEKVITGWIAGQNSAPKISATFCIELNATKQFIGLIGLKFGKPNYKTAEVWYKLHLSFWKRGYATEALAGMLAFSFNELKLHRIEAGSAVENIASIKVLEKAGMKREGMKRKKLPVRGEWKDNYFYAILEEDFYNNKQAIHNS